jgi:hypothetical protein
MLHRHEGEPGIEQVERFGHGEIIGILLGHSGNVADTESEALGEEGCSRRACDDLVRVETQQIAGSGTDISRKGHWNLLRPE